MFIKIHISLKRYIKNTVLILTEQILYKDSLMLLMLSSYNFPIREVEIMANTLYFDGLTL